MGIPGTNYVECRFLDAEAAVGVGEALVALELWPPEIERPPANLGSK